MKYVNTMEMIFPQKEETAVNPFVNLFGAKNIWKCPTQLGLHKQDCA